MFAQALVFAVLTQTSPANPTPLRPSIGTEALQLRLPPTAGQFFFGPWWSPSVAKNGVKLELGYFGGNADQVFGLSPLAMTYAQKYHDVKATGFGLAISGAAVALAGIAPMFATREPNWQVAGAGMYLGGLAAAIVGQVLLWKAQHELERAVDAYNADLDKGR